MAVRPHRAFDSAKENFSTAGLFLTIPSIRRASMQDPQLMQQSFYIRCFTRA
jgi:hypothetical protein